MHFFIDEWPLKFLAESHGNFCSCMVSACTKIKTINVPILLELALIIRLKLAGMVN